MQWLFSLACWEMGEFPFKFFALKCWIFSSFKLKNSLKMYLYKHPIFNQTHRKLSRLHFAEGPQTSHSMMCCCLLKYHQTYPYSLPYCNCSLQLLFRGGNGVDLYELITGWNFMKVIIFFFNLSGTTIIIIYTISCKTCGFKHNAWPCTTYILLTKLAHIKS